MIKGYIPALVTPFTQRGGVDFSSFKKLIEYQLSGGADGLLFLGTTGEPSVLTAEEKLQIIEFAVAEVKKRVPVIIGVGCNCTSSAVQNAADAADRGADALLAVTPYYNKCTQNGLTEYYAAVAAASALPVIAYNVPKRTCVNILPATAEKLSRIKNVVAIKEASGDVAQIAETARLIEGKMSLFSGDDALTLPIMSLGAAGLISVAGNAAPKEVSALTRLCLENKWVDARTKAFLLAPLFSACFAEINPIPVKYALSKLGLCENVLRAPLTKAEKETMETMDKQLLALKLI